VFRAVETREIILVLGAERSGTEKTKPFGARHEGGKEEASRGSRAKPFEGEGRRGRGCTRAKKSRRGRDGGGSRRLPRQACVDPGRGDTGVRARE